MADILIVVATELEAGHIFGKKFKPSRGKVIPLKGVSSVHHYDLLITGPGMVSTTWWLSRCMLSKPYSLAVNLGICGSSDPEIKPVRIVQITSDRFADFGSETASGHLDAFELGFEKPNSFPYRNGVIRKSFRKKLNCISAISAANGITLNLCTGTDKRKKQLISKYGFGMESMEGAAFFYSCALAGIPSLQIRAVSNKTGKRERKKWKISEALDALEGFTGLLMMELETTKL